MEDDIDIYEDLPSIRAEQETSHHLSPNGNDYEQLRKQIEELSTELQKFRKVNQNLEVNFSSLLRTAKAEIARKDRIIAELRRELDDSSFRRGSYAKVPKSTKPQKHAARESSPIQRPSVDISLPCNKIKLESMETMDSDGPSDEVDDQLCRNQLNLPSTTIYGERLRKRLMDEENEERQQKEQQQSKLNLDGNSNEFAEGYIAESDKENGSRRSVRCTDSKENQSRPIQLVRESNAKNIDGSKGNATTTIKSELHSMDETKVRVCKTASTLPVKYVGKRRNDETSESMSIKRMKLDKEETGYQRDCSGKEDHTVGHVRLSEKRMASNERKPDRTVDLVREKRTSRRTLSNSRERDDIMNGHITKRLLVSNEKPKRGFEERISDRRCHESSRNGKRDGHRIDDPDYYRTKHRETHRIERRTNDHRLHTKSWNSHPNYHDERHINSKSDKYTSYAEKRCNNEYKSTVIKISKEKEGYDLRSLLKRSTSVCKRTSNTALTEINRRRKDERCESRRLRNNDRLLSNERESKRSLDVDKPIAEIEIKRSPDRSSSRCSEDSKVEPTEMKLPIRMCKSSLESTTQIKAETPLGTMTCLEEGQLPPTPVKEDQTINNEAQSGCRKSVDNLEQAENVAVKLDIRCTSSINGEFVSTEKSGLDNSDLVENVENIEKFLRDYGSQDREFKSEKTSSMPGKELDGEHNKNVSTDIISLLHDSVSTDHNDTTEVSNQIQDNKQNNDNHHDSSSEVKSCSSNQAHDVSSSKTNCCLPELPEGRILVHKDYTILSTQIRKDDVPKEDINLIAPDESSVPNDSQPAPYDENIITEELTLKSKNCNKSNNDGRDCEDAPPDLDENENKNKNNDVGNGDSDTDCNGKNVVHADIGNDFNKASEDNSKKINNLIEKDKEDTRISEEKRDERNVASKSTENVEKKVDNSADGQELLRNVSKPKRTDRRVSQMNVQGKIVVFVRRRKPVCLADTNASMTVLVSSSNGSVDSSNTAAANSSSNLKIRTCKS